MVKEELKNDGSLLDRKRLFWVEMSYEYEIDIFSKVETLCSRYSRGINSSLTGAGGVFKVLR